MVGPIPVFWTPLSAPPQDVAMNKAGNLLDKRFVAASFHL
jgi:hypothetical protein